MTTNIVLARLPSTRNKKELKKIDTSQDKGKIKPNLKEFTR